MIQSILFFAFGFLGAILLALMLAPALWRRAEKLTRKQLEATLPLSLNEIQADKDRLRAESAMAVRSLEISAAELRDRNNHLMLEFGHLREEIRKINEKNLVAREENLRLASESDDLRSRLGKREAELASLQAETKALNADYLALQSAHGELNGQYSETVLLASNRQVELVARDADNEKLTHELGGLRGKRAEIEARLKEAHAAMKAAQESLRNETRKSADLQKRHDKTIAALAEREEQLLRRDGDLARIRTELRDANKDKAAASKALTEFQRSQARQAAADQKAAGTARSPAILKESPDGDALLRKQIQDLAAQVVVMTAALEGDPLPGLGKNGRAAKGAPASLAENVRKLQAKAAKA